MKIRTGFVSNSSSSSFVMLGAKVGDLKISEDRMKEMMDEYDIEYDAKYFEDAFWDALHDEQFNRMSYLDEPGVVGWMLATDSNYTLEETTTSLKVLKKQAKEIKAIVKEMFGLDVDIQLITGTYPC